MNQKIYVVCYNRNNTVNISINVYELDHETPVYLFLKEYSSSVRYKKDSLTWFTTLDDAKIEVRRVLVDEITKLTKRLTILKNINNVSVHEIPSESYVGPITLE